MPVDGGVRASFRLEIHSSTSASPRATSRAVELWYASFSGMPWPKERHDEDPHGVLGPEPLGEPVGEPVRARFQHRRYGPRCVIVTAALEVRTRDGHSLRLDVHENAFTQMPPG